MTIYNIALIGFGGVNRALAELIATKNSLWERDLGFRLNTAQELDRSVCCCTSAGRRSGRTTSSRREGPCAGRMSQPFTIGCLPVLNQDNIGRPLQTAIFDAADITSRGVGPPNI